MTLSGWIRPSESQSGWGTILHHQTDAYVLMAPAATARAASGRSMTRPFRSSTLQLRCPRHAIYRPRLVVSAGSFTTPSPSPSCGARTRAIAS